MIKISKTKKLDGISSWSLEAGKTCPGSHNSDGSLVPACSGCYAKSGNYHYPNVKAPREHNKKDWKRVNWVADMVAELDNHRYFRWFDSGDVYCVELAEKILEVMKLTPWVKHWLPTRSYKFKKIDVVLKKMAKLSNVAVRRSADSVDGRHNKRVHGSVIIPSAHTDVADHVNICEAYIAKNNGKCNGCRACWDKSVKTIAYVAHGASMKKVIRLAKAA